jgi:hypothetical protein
MPHTTQAQGLKNVAPMRILQVSTFDLISLLHLALDRVQSCKTQIMSGVDKQKEYSLRDDIKYWEDMRGRIEKTIADPYNYM